MPAKERGFFVAALLAMTLKELPSRPQLQALQSGRDVQAHLALHAERLQRDRIVRAADQHVAADADADRGAALRAGVIAGEIAGPEPATGAYTPQASADSWVMPRSTPTLRMVAM